MSSIPQQSSSEVQRKRSPMKLLYNGDKMTQPRFHRLYERMPHEYKAELIGGMVFEPSPLGYLHGTEHAHLGGLLLTYAAYTPGTRVADNATVILGEEDEVQPDLLLRIERNGTSQISKKNFIEGPPELVVEIAHSTHAIDLHLKKDRYSAAGVTEYIVLSLSPNRIFWFDLASGKELKSDGDCIYRSTIFPGLWIHGEALLRSNSVLTLETIGLGLQSQEHTDFVAALERGTQTQ